MNNEPIQLNVFLETATEEQIECLGTLNDLATEEAKLSKKINEIYACVKQGIYKDKDGISLCESEDDANVLSLSYKIKLVNIRKQISQLLEKAINELDMGNVGIIQRQYKNYVSD